MSEHPSTGPVAPATERIPTDPAQAQSPATQRIPTDVPADVPLEVPPRPAEAPVHPADAAYLPAVAPAAAPLPGEPGHGKPYVTIVLPCYNEAAHVLQEIDRITTAMNSSEFTYEVLCIDDASTDDTLAVLEQAGRDYANLRVMPFRRNGGSGTARRIGTQQAHGE